MLGLKSFRTAKAIISGIEAMHMIKKKQVYQELRSVQNQKEFIHQLFGLTAEDQGNLEIFAFYIFFNYLHQNRKP